MTRRSEGWRAAPSACPRFPVPGGQAEIPLAKNGKAPAGTSQRNVPTKAPEARQIVAHGETVGLVVNPIQAPDGATENQPPVIFFRPLRGWIRLVRLTHGSRRGLRSAVAPRLRALCPVRPPQTTIGRCLRTATNCDFAGECARPGCHFRRRAVQRRQARHISTTQNQNNLQPRRGGIFRPHPDDVAPDGALSVGGWRGYKYASPDGLGKICVSSVFHLWLKMQPPFAAFVPPNFFPVVFPFTPAAAGQWAAGRPVAWRPRRACARAAPVRRRAAPDAAGRPIFPRWQQWC